MVIVIVVATQIALRLCFRDTTVRILSVEVYCICTPRISSSRCPSDMNVYCIFMVRSYKQQKIILQLYYNHCDLGFYAREGHSKLKVLPLGNRTRH